MTPPITVLVVEDEPLIRLDITEQLQEEGYEVLEAANASEAIALLERIDRIRLIFTDIDMPGGMDGLKLAAAVRHRWPPVQIVITSGHRMVDIADMPDGSVFFRKPYHHRIVAESMRELLLQ
jgi:CheY-like chemotaxis protein